MLQEQGLSYADATGNLRLELDRPAFSSKASARIRIRGEVQTRAELAQGSAGDQGGSRSLGLRAATWDQTAGRSLGCFAWVDLPRCRLPRTRGDSDPRRCEPNRGGGLASAIWRWSEDYDFTKMNAASVLEPRGLEVVQERLRGSELQYVIRVCRRRGHRTVCGSRAITIFVDDPPITAEKLELKPATSASNVILAAPYDPVAFDRSTEREGLRYAAVSQVAVDLLSGPGRSQSEAEALIAWMVRNESAWRLPPPSS